MSLLSLREVSVRFSGAPVLDGVDLEIDLGERICVLGRNGEGKSTLLKVINRDMEPDLGSVMARKGTKSALLSQDVPMEINGSVFEVVCDALGEAGKYLARYRRLSARMDAGDSDGALLEELGDVQEAIDARGGWEQEQAVRTVISRLHLIEDAEFSGLSGGVKRRVMLARVLVLEPDILILDEPTNHLDIDSIKWLEEFLAKSTKTLVFVSHDRAFLKKLATRIVELDRGRLSSWSCDYETHLVRKEEALAVEEQERALFEKKLAKEEVWIRQGIKARRTRNEGRVRALKKMREERAGWRDLKGKAKLEVQEADRSGTKVAVVENLHFSYGDRPIVKDFSTVIFRGDKIGFIGLNGSGKTTLLQLLLGKLKGEGSVVHGTRLEVVYFDQLREQLDPNASVMDSVSDVSDRVTVNGVQKHVMSYLQDFLFTPDRARSPVKMLSGGERNRLLLARLFTKPANVLVMDEPTNDLDIETLDLLEELLSEFSGTLLLVSHDRAFLDNVVTRSFVFEGEGKIRPIAGGYEEWERISAVEEAKRLEKERTVKQAERKASEPAKRVKFGNKLQRELEGLPLRIEALENEQNEIIEKMAEPDFASKELVEIEAVKERLQVIELEMQQLFERWEELEALRESCNG